MTTMLTGYSYPLLIVASDDPYPTPKRLRDEDPAHYSRTEQVWVLTRYADVAGAFKDWKTWSSQQRGNLLNDTPDPAGKIRGTTDSPRHTFARGSVNAAVTPKTVAGLKAVIDRLARQLCGRAQASGAIEFVADISAPYNAAMLGAMFGVPESDFIQLRHWLDDFFRRDAPPPGQEPAQVVAIRHLREYMLGRARSRQQPVDDLLAAMLPAEENGQRLQAA
jgi:cytochrome P450